MKMEMIRLGLNNGDFVEFTGKMLFSFRENAETRITLYKCAEKEFGDYLLHVEEAGQHKICVCHINENTGLDLTPVVTSKPDTERR